MNPFDFVKASGGGDSLMPIVIFVIWIVISYFSNAQKRKKKLEQTLLRKKSQAPAHHAPEATSLPGTMTQTEEKRTPLFDSVRREFEVAPSTQQKKEKTVPPQLEESTFSLETKEVEEQSYEVPPPISLKSEPPKVLQIPLTTPFNAYSLAVPLNESDGIASTAIGDVFSKDQQEKTAEHLIVEREEVRKGFVWSEILAAPVALRDPS